MQHRSLTIAAREHRMDPSRVSRIIRALETELGLPLLKRTTRNISPTEAGLFYQAELEPLIEAFHLAQRRTADMQAQPSGTLRISSPVSFGILNIVPLLPEFLSSHPLIKLDLSLVDTAPDLAKNRYDAAIVLGPLKDSDAIAVPLAEMRPRICASPSYLEIHGIPQTPMDLINHNCLILDMPGFDSIWRFRLKGKSSSFKEVPIHGTLITSNAIALKECAIMGLGIILQADWIVQNDLRRGSLVELFPEYQVTAATFRNPAMWLVHPALAYVPLKVRFFIDFIKSKFN